MTGRPKIALHPSLAQDIEHFPCVYGTNRIFGGIPDDGGGEFGSGRVYEGLSEPRSKEGMLEALLPPDVHTRFT